jgi:hypothetical protein
MAIVNQGWLDQNSQRAYPLSEEATRLDETGTYRLPDNLLVDFILPINSALEYNPASFYLSKLSIFGTGITLEFSYWTGATEVFVGRTTVTESSFDRDDTYFVQGTGDFEGVLGKVVVHSLSTVFQQSGVYNFDLSGGRLESTVIVPDIRGITGLRILDGDDIGELYQGDIAFEAGSNMRITKSDYNGIVVLELSAIDGEGTIAECVCEGDVSIDAAVRTINNVVPDSNGNINLLGDDCLQVTPKADESAVEITDVCSKPCCGCPELETLVEDQNRMRDQVQTLENLASRLESNVQILQTLITSLNPC